MKRVGLVLILAFVGCGPAAVEPDANTTGLIPLAVGAEWTYSVADSGPSPLFPDSIVTATILRDSVALGIRWYLADRVDLVGNYPSFPWIRNAVGGVYQTGSPTYISSFLMFPYPAVVGATSLLGWRVADVDTLVTVPAGSFHAVRYEQLVGGPGQPQRPVQWKFVAQGVGVVKAVSVLSHDGAGNILASRVRVLTRYKP